MAIQERTELYAKEIDDVMFLLVDFVTKLKSGTPFTTAALEQIQNAINAAAGIDQADDEFAANMPIAIRTITARAGELAGVLLKKNDVVPVVG